ncbi:MAG: exodeoxyribonuclease V subunit gamma [Victivallales bacterium]|nr:exodeoxyribonuclease V subunit gamma [Victivallales bacterium]MCF7889444.1 exodeoxyribonuclease V subunit gamma [Victivallales bacterium]
MAFIPYISNKLEPLAKKLCEVLRSDSSDGNIFQKDYIIVQAKGMEQWLKYRIADNNGIYSLIDFPYPEAFLENFFPKGNRDLISNNIKFNREILIWSVLKELPEIVRHDMETGEGLFKDIRKYLYKDTEAFNDNYDVKLLQLSEKIAETFYKYLAYRPDCLLNWEGVTDPGFNIPDVFKENSWQKVLWNKILENSGSDYLPKRVYKSIKNNDLEKIASSGPIKRAFIFGITTMPPFFLEIFLELSKYIDIHFFYRNICSDNWEDNLSAKELFRYFKNLDEEIYVHKEGNELLGAFAQKEREFFSLLVSGGFVDSEGDYISYGSADSKDKLLTLIQNDILNMTEPEEKVLLNQEDKSIQFHSFHSPMREIESLYDYLLKVMDDSKGEIKPKDILVMAPDIQVYAPYIEAVFESKKNKENYIHYTIADRNVKDTNIEAEVFLDLLKLLKSRFKVTEVLSILSVKSVYRSFGFEEEDLELVHKWLKECSVKWGIDKDNRKEFLQNEDVFYENSWMSGLDRMLLGYPMTSSERDIKNSLYQLEDEYKILPYEEIEGSNSIVLGKLLKFTDELFKLKSLISEKKSPEEWRDILSRIIDTFFAADTDRDENIEVLYRSVNSMCSDMNTVGFDEKLDIDPVSYYLGKNLQEKVSFLQFLRGGVTFCKFTPMRSVPAKIICMIGMNDGDFPGNDSRTGFDLMQYNVRKCDPSSKNEERYMFLEGLVSTTEELYISYIGRSVKDNTKKLPSIVVSELKEYIDSHYCLKDLENDTASSYLSVEHPLHSFSPEYFKNVSNSMRNLSLYSFSTENCLVAELLNSSTEERRQYILDFSSELPDIDEFNVSVDDLVSFFTNPSKYLLKTRLDIDLEVRLNEELEDKEIIELNNLEKYKLNQDLLSILDRGIELNDKENLSYLKSKGVVPPGKWGELAIEELIINTNKFKEILTEFLKEKNDEMFTDKLTVELGDIPTANVSMEFSDLYKNGQIFYRLGSERIADLIRIWIYHVTLCASNYSNEKLSYFITWDKKNAEMQKTVFPVLGKDAAVELLKKMLEAYYTGLKRPLPFFPESSFEFTKEYIKMGDEEKAYNKALDRWGKDRYNLPDSRESADCYLNFCFGDNLPPADKVKDIALSFYEPLLNNKCVE